MISLKTCQLSTNMIAKINRCENFDQVLLLLFQNALVGVKKALR